MKRLVENSGFTLIESVIVMILFIILVTGFASIYAFTSVTTYHAGHNSIANASARTDTDKLLADVVNPSPSPADRGTANIKFHGTSTDVPIDNVIRETGESTADVTGRTVEFKIYRKEP